MNRFIAFALLILLCTPAFAQEGTLERRSFTHDNILRHYRLYIPASYDGTETWPLVINYHGYLQNASAHVNFTRMNLVADTARVLVAYPDGLLVDNPFHGSFGKGWNIHGGMLANHDDLGFGRQMIEHIRADYLFDPARVHVTGYSMGAGMAYEMACAYPDIIASVSGVAEQMSADILANCDPDRAIAVLIIHGTHDRFLSIIGTSSGGIRFPAVSETISFWADVNNCSTGPVETEVEDIDPSDFSTVTLIQHTDCDDDMDVLFYRVNLGGHSWPGGIEDPNPNYGNWNRDINAGAEMINFLKQHPHPQPTVNTSTGQADLQYTFSVDMYPNPFVDHFTVEFDMPNPGDVAWSLVNVLGQEIHTAAPLTYPTGRNRIEWQGEDEQPAPGLYLLRLHMGDVVLTKPLLHVRR